MLVRLFWFSAGLAFELVFMVLGQGFTGFAGYGLTWYTVCLGHGFWIGNKFVQAMVMWLKLDSLVLFWFSKPWFWF